jgi:alkanesulfonate monooxygenase SsuD/methylene tetrahydromethanopterin reductase-like flavin-dependent oxidoreductase (luciferase family)
LIGGSAEVAIRRAARLADGIFANATVDKFLRMVHWVEDELDEIGRDPDEFRIVHYSVILPGDSEEEAWERYMPHQWHMMWKYSDMEASATRTGPPPAAPPLTDEGREAIRARSTIAGTGEEIVAQLHDIRDKSSLDVEFVARSYFHTLTYEEQFELMERLATEVAPQI